MMERHECGKCGSVVYARGFKLCPDCKTPMGDSEPEESTTLPTEASAVTGARWGDYYFTGTHWLAVPTPTLASAYFIRAMVLVIFANLVALCGGVVVVAFGEDGLGFFIVTAIIAMVLILIAATSYYQGNSSLSEYERFARPPKS